MQNAFLIKGIQNEKTKVQVDSDRAILVDNETVEQQVDPDKHIPFHNRYRLQMKASIYSKDGGAVKVNETMYRRKAEKKFSCVVCGLRFHLLQNMQRHLQTHAAANT